MKWTEHAAVQIQQRGIPPLVVDLLLQFGRREHDHRGAEIVYFDRNSRSRIEKYTGGLIGKLSGTCKATLFWQMGILLRSERGTKRLSATKKKFGGRKNTTNLNNIL